MRPVSAYIFKLSSLILLALCMDPVPAQIYAPTANYTDTVTYPGYPRTDPYFVFHAPEHGIPVTGTLRASLEGDTIYFDVSWSRYDPSTNSFGPPFFTQTGVTASSAQDLEAGCYRAHITAAGLDTMFRAWVFINDPEVKVVNKDDSDKLLPAWGYSCARIVLEGEILADTMIYYNLSTGERLFLPNGMAFEWTCDDPEYRIFGGDLYTELTIYYEPPYSSPPTKDTWFFLTAVDSFDLIRQDDVLYESVHVNADFRMWYQERSDSEEEGDWQWVESDKPEEESPLEVRFHNHSENGTMFEWILVDSAKTGDEAKFVTYDLNDSVSYTYYIPGYYYPSMIAYSEEGCPDTVSPGAGNEIHVLPSELDAPNVFTPNGDGVNDYFMVRAKSLKYFRITIYDRSGSKVYEYEHLDGRFEWMGWDGTIKGKGENFAEPGVYYYVIDALGWDATVYRDAQPYTGFVYLFREAQ